MIKKILLILLIFGIFLGNTYSYEYKDPDICKGEGKNKINCSAFEIQTSVFSPGSQTILNKAQEGGGDSTKSANAILNTIIKNLIVVFGVLSLLMMTIGGGMMIFHAGQESILTKGKGIFMWGIISLTIGLASGLIVKFVSYILY